MSILRNVLSFSFLIVVGSTALFAQGVPQTSQTGGNVSPTSFSAKVIGNDDDKDGYRIGYQDIIDVLVFNQPKLTQKVAVGPTGTIVLFRIDHPIVAVCRTERELADDIRAAYKEKYLKDPQVSVAVSEQKSRSIAVIGAVERPGNYFISKKVHLLEMLAYAGGPNKEAGTRLLVARSGSSSVCREKDAPNVDENVSVLDFKLRDIQEGKQTLWMQPGDVISVLDADIVYVYGNVNHQGALKVRDPITLTQALASAEGLKPAAQKDKIRILRQTPGKADREEFVYDLGQIDKGKVKDPYLEPNDIVAVSQDKSKAILLGVANAIKTSVPNAVYRLP
jgi:polysaccharide export outer membrane protein